MTFTELAVARQEAKDRAAGVVQERPRVGDFGLTSSGRRFWPADPRVDDICIGDIAHALSMQCRFGGHSKAFYSVAQHSVLVARLVSPGNALVGLLHDATEAYLQDIIRPLKRELRATYKPLETAWAGAIGLVFGLGDLLADLPKEVHDADRAVLVAEHRDLMAPCPQWPVGESKLARIDPWDPARAKDEFWRAFRLYSGASE